MNARRPGLTRVRWRFFVAPVVICLFGPGVGCELGGGPDEAGRHNDLQAMQTARIEIKGHVFEAWLARTSDELETGLMNTPEEALAPIADPAGEGQPDIQRGMLFIFRSEQILSFWMLNTIIPLDIAYINQDGEIVKTYTMAPLETRQYPSHEPAMFALEMRAGLLAELGIGLHDHVEIPEAVLKGGS